ncbi:hypothetical protein B0H10DRAFT_1795337 [Mycena sp. CBHHK59/15]|nr:hypothetical protein B0H10DRAFT_1795337 [Mycena sp. CBHHK59/15]
MAAHSEASPDGRNHRTATDARRTCTCGDRVGKDGDCCRPACPQEQPGQGYADDLAAHSPARRAGKTSPHTCEKGLTHIQWHKVETFRDEFKLKAIAVSERVLTRDPMDEFRQAFQLFDDDGTGKISLRNLRRVAKEIGDRLEDDQLQSMIDEFDLDQDGEINEQEFIAIMKDDA